MVVDEYIYIYMWWSDLNYILRALVIFEFRFEFFFAEKQVVGAAVD